MHSSNANDHDITFHPIMVLIRTVCWRQLWYLDFVKPSNVVLHPLQIGSVYQEQMPRLSCSQEDFHKRYDAAPAEILL